MNKLALDLGNNMGYAISINDDITGGCLKIKKNKMDFYRWLYEQCDSYDIDQIFYEEITFIPKQNGKKATELYGFFRHAIESICLEKNILLTPIKLATIRKCFVGSIYAKKEHVLRLLKLEGYEFEDHNQADAMACLIVGIRQNKMRGE